MDCAVSAIVTSSSDSDGGIVPTWCRQTEGATARTHAVSNGE